MIELAVEQGSVAWTNARLGIATASCFSKIISPKKLAPSAQRGDYLCAKVYERLTGLPADSAASGVMTRGSELEAEAVAWFEFQHDATTRKAGICLSDDRRIGASPDRFVGDDGLLEVKCPLGPAHLSALLYPDEDGHRLQIQGQLWLSGRSHCWLLSFFPGLPVALRRVERDEECIAALAEHVAAFADEIDAAEARIRALRGETQAA